MSRVHVIFYPYFFFSPLYFAKILAKIQIFIEILRVLCYNAVTDTDFGENNA